MSERMCPIMAASTDDKEFYCVGQKCAWWDMNVEQCAVLNTSVCTTRIVRQLAIMTVQNAPTMAPVGDHHG